MITYPRLGFMGQLGNQFFEMAAAIAVAIDNKDSFGFPRWTCMHGGVADRDIKCNPPCHTVYDKLLVKKYLVDKIPDGPSYNEPYFQYAPIPYKPNLRLSGYFQSEKYFKHHADIIRELFTPVDFLKSGKLLKVASIHVTMPTHVYAQLPLSYYERAIDVMIKVAGVERFIVFCFDPIWCRERYKMFSSSLFQVAEAASLIEHFTSMMLCEHHIIANSTYSWWAAWIDPNLQKKVICSGKNWFNSEYVNKSVSSLYPEEWVKIE